MLRIKAKPVNGQCAGCIFHPHDWVEWPDGTLTEAQKEAILACDALEVEVVDEGDAGPVDVSLAEPASEYIAAEPEPLVLPPEPELVVTPASPSMAFVANPDSDLALEDAGPPEEEPGPESEEGLSEPELDEASPDQVPDEDEFMAELLAVKGIGRQLARRVIDAGVPSMGALEQMTADDLAIAGIRPSDAVKIAKALAG